MVIHFFCALYCEAEILVQHFKLTKLKQFQLFSIYQSEDKKITLTITGVGKFHSASAVHYHHTCIETHPADIWLNMGIAGHKDLDIGEIRLVNKITDEQKKTCWFPQIIFEPPFPCMTLITIDKPSTDYQNDLFDMESSGFYATASKLGTSELIHCIKIISDNRRQAAHTVSAKRVKKLIRKNLHNIRSIVKALIPLSEELNYITITPAEYEKFIEKWHFTESQRFQLKKLLRRWSLLLPNTGCFHSVHATKTGKDVLKHIKKTLDKTTFNIYI